MEKMEMINNLIKKYEMETGVSFKGDLKLNGRLTRALGRCSMMAEKDLTTGEIISVIPTRIEISKRFLSCATDEEVAEVVAHEYAHYCTTLKVGLHDHDTKEFKEYCRLLKSTSSPNLKLKNQTLCKYSIYCSCCNRMLGAKSNSNARVIKYPNSFTSKCCGASLKIVKNY